LAAHARTYGYAFWRCFSVLAGDKKVKSGNRLHLLRQATMLKGDLPLSCIRRDFFLTSRYSTRARAAGD
jgi:hypothetical protein